MTLSLDLANDIVADVLDHCEQQVLDLKSLTSISADEPEAYMQLLTRLDARLLDIRQGLYAAAYVAIGSIPSANETGRSRSLSETAIATRARRYFREG